MGSLFKGRCPKAQATPTGARFVLVIEDRSMPGDTAGGGTVAITLQSGQDMQRANTPAACLIRRLSDWLDEQQRTAPQRVQQGAPS